MKTPFLSILLLFCFVGANGQNINSIPDVSAYTQIGSATNGGPTLVNSDQFGTSVAYIGDLNNDGTEDIVVGAPGNDDMGSGRGAVYILFMTNSRTVGSMVKISDSSSAITLTNGDNFGVSVAGLGDMNRDGNEDIAVGAFKSDNGATGDVGAVYILFLNSSGGIVGTKKITTNTDSQLPTFSASSLFGVSVTLLGDVNNDGDDDIAVGHYMDDLGGTDRGCAWVLLLDSAATILDAVQIGHNTNGFDDFSLDNQDLFGFGIHGIGDFDGDGVEDVVIGSIGDDDGLSNLGAVYICLLDTAGTVDSTYKINQPIFSSTSYYLPSSTEYFGSSITSNDINKDGIPDLLIGAYLESTGGCFYQLLMNADGTCIDMRKIGDNQGWNYSIPAATDQFGIGISVIGDLESDGKLNIAVGASLTNLGGTSRGCIYVFNMNDPDTLLQEGFCMAYSKIADISGAFGGTLDNSDFFGLGIASLGYLNGGTNPDIGIGAYMDDDGGGGSTNRGAFWVLFLDENGKDSAYAKIISGTTNFVTLDNDDRFGSAAANIGDIDGDGTTDIAVAATLDDDGGTNRGAVYIIFMNKDGSVKATSKINSSSLTSGLTNSGNFGCSVALIGDINNDGVNDIAVGGNQDDDGGTDKGAIWVIRLNSNGSVRGSQKISDTTGGFSETFSTNTTNFGSSVGYIGDFNGDGIEDVLAGSTRMDTVGAVYIMYLDTSGAVTGYKKISTKNSNFPATISNFSGFGASVQKIDDLDGNGVDEIIISQLFQNNYGLQKGGVWITFMDENGDVYKVQNLSNDNGRFYGPLDQDDFLGYSMAYMGDFNGDGNPDVIMGARGDDEGGTDRGSVWIISLEKKKHDFLFARPKKSLDGGYYTSDNGYVFFEFNEGYNTGELSFAIYDNTRTVVSWSGTDAASLYNYVSNSNDQEFGTNRFRLDISCNGAELRRGYYVMEITNEKNEKMYLRFYNSRDFTCSPFNLLQE